MKITYLIDSENINDVWVELLQCLEAEDKILIFFTDKSAHMGYDRIIRLMEQEKGTLQWIRCFEGQNALDFQLVTELGHQICMDPEREYVIVSNDTGYDAAIRYWQKKGCSVRRMKGVECEHLLAEAKKRAERRKRDEEKEAEEERARLAAEAARWQEKQEEASELEQRRREKGEEDRFGEGRRKAERKERGRKTEERTMDKPAEGQLGRKAERTEEKTAGRMTEKPAVETAVEKAAGKAVEKAAGKAVEKAAGKAGEKKGEAGKKEGGKKRRREEKETEHIRQHKTPKRAQEPEKKKEGKTGRALPWEHPVMRAPMDPVEPYWNEEDDQPEEDQLEDGQSFHMGTMQNDDWSPAAPENSGIELDWNHQESSRLRDGEQDEAVNEEKADSDFREGAGSEDEDPDYEFNEGEDPEAESPDAEADGRKKPGDFDLEEEDFSFEPEYEEEPEAPYEREYEEEPEASYEREYEEEPEAPYEPEYGEEPEASYGPEYEEEEPEAPYDPEYGEEPEAPYEPEYEEEPEVPYEPEYEEEPEAPYEPEYEEEPEAPYEPEYETEEEAAGPENQDDMVLGPLLEIFADAGSSSPERDLRFLQDLCKTIRISDMSLLHNVLEYQFGQAMGNGVYRFLKKNPQCRSQLSAGYCSSKKQRERQYLKLILERNQMDGDGTDRESIWKLLNAVPRKNLNGIHSGLIKRFGQEQGGNYYAVLRNHIKIIRSL